MAGPSQFTNDLFEDGGLEAPEEISLPQRSHGKDVEAGLLPPVSKVSSIPKESCT